jgi:tRNA modification GTPase
MTDPGADTIVAVSTPAGNGLRAVVRLSGPDACPCVEGRFRPQNGSGRDWRKTFRSTPGHLRLTADALRLPALLYVMRAPHSYTREDVVELHVPGSPALLDMILDDLLATGPGVVRLAEPGEFTRRAFLNGRIDLSQAEAVLAVIRSRSESELRAAVAKVNGSASRRCLALQEQVTELRVRIEAALDFAVHGIETVAEEEFVTVCDALCATMEREIRKGRGEVASDGAVHVVIAGPPNAGKSSLLNRLAGTDASIVHPRAGTTRDVVRAEIETAGVRFRLSDTAGLTAASASEPDEAAVRRAMESVRSCQLLILVLDGSAALPQGALEPARLMPPSRVLCVINKCDLPQVIDQGALRSGPTAGAAAPWEALHTSALTGEGIADLQAALGRVVTEGRLDASASDCLFNARQRVAVRRAIAQIRMAEGAVREGMGYEFAALNLREAAAALGRITGDVDPQDVLDRIFSRFCIGK